MITSLDLQERYDRESSVYDAKRYHSPKGRYYEREEASLLQKICLGDHPIILDVATGTGKNLVALSSTCRLIVGVDISQNMLGKAREKCETAGIRNCALIQADAGRLPFYPDKFNVVVTTKFFHNLPRQTHHHFYREMERVGKHLIVLELLNKFSWFGCLSFVACLKSAIRGRSQRRDYLPWQYRKITVGKRRARVHGFSTGLPKSDFMFKRFNGLFRFINKLFMHSAFRFIAPKIFVEISLHETR
jgi:ubiquinone/menaquinone biosynthesis C-methylase UbiE